MDIYVLKLYSNFIGMARIELSSYLSNDVINIIQEKLLPDKKEYTFLGELVCIWNYSLCIICDKPNSIISLKLLLKIYNFSTKEELKKNCKIYNYCKNCYPFFLMRFMKNDIYVKEKKI